MSRSPNTGAAVRLAARGFTLIELLVVLIIIAVIIAIVLPALGLARSAARAATTRGMMTNISNAAGVFINDNKRTPGYFTARQMGDVSNLTQGMSALQNIMLDLAGFSTGATMVGPGTIAGTQVGIELDAIEPAPYPSNANGTPLLLANSTNGKSYFVPDSKHWKRQDRGGQQLGSAQNQFLASVIDDFGNPILAWAIDETAVGQIKTEDDFAATSIRTNGASRRFYWASNAAFLSASSLGTRGYNQTDPNSGSMIGSTSSSSATPPPDAVKSLCGILGSPSFPYRDPAAAGGPAPTVPASARAPFVLQSAGADGVYFGRKDRGAKQFSTGYIDYQMGLVKKSGASETQANFYLDKDGKRETLDVTKAFDDILTTGGN